MADFARRAAEEFAKDAPAQETAEAAAHEPVPLAAQGLIWVVIKAYWRRFLQAIGVARQPSI